MLYDLSTEFQSSNLELSFQASFLEFIIKEVKSSLWNVLSCNTSCDSSFQPFVGLSMRMTQEMEGQFFFVNFPRNPKNEPSWLSFSAIMYWSSLVRNLLEYEMICRILVAMGVVAQ
jgi:hypothetical protein